MRELLALGRRTVTTSYFVICLAMLATAQTASGLAWQLGQICQTIVGIVPIVALLMFIMAGFVYAAGQIFGAETRSRANVWSTTMLVGGIIGLVLAASAPYFLAVFSRATLGNIGQPMDVGEAVELCNP